VTGIQSGQIYHGTFGDADPKHSLAFDDPVHLKLHQASALQCDCATCQCGGPLVRLDEVFGVYFQGLKFERPSRCLRLCPLQLKLWEGLYLL
jgi:hypothetical protein